MPGEKCRTANATHRPAPELRAGRFLFSSAQRSSRERLAAAHGVRAGVRQNCQACGIPRATTDAALIVNVGNSRLRKPARQTAPGDRSPRRLWRGRPRAMRGTAKPAEARVTTCAMQFKPGNALLRAGSSFL